METYREYKARQLQELYQSPAMGGAETARGFDVARNASQGRSAFKGMNPKLTAFGANLASALAEIEQPMPGFTRKFITKIINTLNTAADLPPTAVSLLKESNASY